MITQIEIVRTTAPQPWHARLVAANGEKVWFTENYAHKEGALHAVNLIWSLNIGSGTKMRALSHSGPDLPVVEVDER